MNNAAFSVENQKRRRAYKARMARTAEIIKGMLLENTGRSLCDSGGTPKYDEKGQYIGSEHGYGRAFEKNKGRDFNNEPPTFINVSAWTDNQGEERVDLTFTHNLYHWLLNRVEYDHKMQRKFDSFARQNPNESHLNLIEEFPLHLREQGYYVTGMFGDETNNFSATYTYNGECCLSQDIQFVIFRVGEDKQDYVALQVHNGCDARGGMTDAKIFKISDSAESLLMVGDVNLVAMRPKKDEDQTEFPFAESEDINVSWMSDNGGYSFYFDGDWESRDRFSNFEDYDKTTDMSQRGKGVVAVDVENNKIYCPVTGWELIACGAER